MTAAALAMTSTTTTTTTTTRFFDATATRFCECDARDEDDDDDDDDEEEEEEELGRIASLCERLEMHLVADEEEAVALTRRVVETIEKETAFFLSSSALKVKGGDKRERRAKAAKRVLTQHHAERLLQKMLVKMLKIGEEEMAGKIGDGIEQLYRLGKERKEVRTFRMEKKKSMVADATASAAEDDEYSDADDDDDERTVELRAVACSQVGADATKRNPEVQLFRMQFNKGVEVRVHESSWSDAGLAWRIWGSAKVAFKVVDRSAYFRDKNKTYLELGSGCGLIGAAIASLGVRCTVTEGAPGALTALRKTAEGVNDVAKTEAMKVAFLDWRDDLATLEEEKNGTVERIEDVPNNNNKSNLSCNFVHANKPTFDNAHVTMRLPEDARFDCVVGSDLVYDQQHCAALAAAIARRLKRPHGEAIIFLAVRSEELLMAFSKKCAKRGLSVGVCAPIEPNENLEDFSKTTGGHAHRALPESADEYWNAVAKAFSECLLSSRNDFDFDSSSSSFVPLGVSSSSSSSSGSTPGGAKDAAAKLEGRFAMVRVTPRDHHQNHA